MAKLTQEFISFILKWEGGYQADPNDSGNVNGGATNRGVTWATYQALCKVVLGHTPSQEEFRKLTPAQSTKFIEYYWNLSGGNAIRNQGIAEELCDWYWGIPGWCVDQVHKLLNKKGYTLPVSFMDRRGIRHFPAFIKETFEAINAQDEKTFLAEIEKAHTGYILSISQPGMKNARYRQGWLNREKDLENLINH